MEPIESVSTPVASSFAEAKKATDQAARDVISQLRVMNEEEAVHSPGFRSRQLSYDELEEKLSSIFVRMLSERGFVRLAKLEP